MSEHDADAQVEGAPESAGKLSAASALGTGAGIAALLLLIRVLAVAHWDWNVAGHILDAFDFGSAVSVAVVELGPAVYRYVIGSSVPGSTCVWRDRVFLRLHGRWSFPPNGR